MDILVQNWERREAEVLAIEKETDLAILKVDLPNPSPCASIGGSIISTFSERFFILGHLPLAEKDKTAVANPEGGRWLEVRLPSVFTASLANEGYDRTSEEPKLATLFFQPEAALPAGSMVCTKDGHVRALSTYGSPPKGTGVAIASEMLKDLLKKKDIQNRRSRFWRLPYREGTPETARGGATWSLHAYLTRHPEQDLLEDEGIEAWQRHLDKLDPAAHSLAEYQAVAADLHRRQERWDEAKTATFAALDGGWTRLASHALLQIAQHQPSQAAFYADGVAKIAARIQGAHDPEPAAALRCRYARLEHELRLIAGDPVGAESAIEGATAQFERTGERSDAHGRIGRARLGQGRSEEAVESFRKITDATIARREWASILESCARSSREADHAYGVRTAVWGLSRPPLVRIMPEWAAICAQKHGDATLAGIFSELAKARYPESSVGTEQPSR